jgi:hypothetical protein
VGRGTHHFLGESLGTFQTSSIGVGAEDRETTLPQLIAKPGHQRRFRSDHYQVDALSLGERDDRRHILGGNVDYLGVGGDTGIAGGAHQAPDTRTAGQAANQGMLPASTADNQDIQTPVIGHGQPSLFR